MRKVLCLKPLRSSPTSPPIDILGKSIHGSHAEKTVVWPIRPASKCSDLQILDAMRPRGDAEQYISTIAHDIVRKGEGLAEIVDALRVAGFAAAVCTSRSSTRYTVSHSHIRVSHDVSIIVVDPAFRSHFELAIGSDKYTLVTDMIPDVFVAELYRFIGVVRNLSELMLTEFNTKMMHAPPWRYPTAMLYRWCP